MRRFRIPRSISPPLRRLLVSPLRRRLSVSPPRRRHSVSPPLRRRFQALSNPDSWLDATADRIGRFINRRRGSYEDDRTDDFENDNNLNPAADLASPEPQHTKTPNEEKSSKEKDNLAISAQLDEVNYTCASNVTVSNFVSVKLSGKSNYDMWRAQMECLMKSHKMRGLVIEGKELPVKENTELRERYEILLNGWLIGSLSEEIIKDKRIYDQGAKGIWDTLEQSYDPISPTASTLLEPRDKKEKQGMGIERKLIKKLHNATLEGHWWKAKSILNGHKGAATWEINVNRDTLFHVAVRLGNNYFLKKLLDVIRAGTETDIEKGNSEGHTALHIAAIVGNKEAAELLVEKRKELLLIKDNDKNIPLACANLNKQVNVFVYLWRVTNESDREDSLSENKEKEKENENENENENDKDKRKENEYEKEKEKGKEDGKEKENEKEKGAEGKENEIEKEKENEKDKGKQEENDKEEEKENENEKDKRKQEENDKGKRNEEGKEKENEKEKEKGKEEENENEKGTEGKENEIEKEKENENEKGKQEENDKEEKKENENEKDKRKQEENDKGKRKEEGKEEQNEKEKRREWKENEIEKEKENENENEKDKGKQEENDKEKRKEEGKEKENEKEKRKEEGKENEIQEGKGIENKNEEVKEKEEEEEQKKGQSLLHTAIYNKQYDLAKDLVDIKPHLAKQPSTLLLLTRNFPSQISFGETVMYPSLNDVRHKLVKGSVLLLHPLECLYARAGGTLWKMRRFKNKCYYSLFQVLVISLLVLEAVPYLIYRLLCLLILLLRLPFSMLYFILWNVLAFLVVPIKNIEQKRKEHKEAKKFLKLICYLNRLKANNSKDSPFDKFYKESLMEAACLDVYEVLDQILKLSSNAMEVKNKDGHNIIQLAVINRSAKVYNLLTPIIEGKGSYRSVMDVFGNNLLHLAGRLAPLAVLSCTSGAALQLQRDLQWHEEIKKFMEPTQHTQENVDYETPEMVFSREHANLVKGGEKWMKTTAESCSITAALIITIVYAASITVPGGSNQVTGIPLFKKRFAFNIFAVADAISLFSASTSLLVFLSILTHRFAEKDFLISLPKRLFIGLCLLFLSTTAMMLAFSTILFIVFCEERPWMLAPIGGLTCFPIAAIVTLQLPLVIDLYQATSITIFSKEPNEEDEEEDKEKLNEEADNEEQAKEEEEKQKFQNIERDNNSILKRLSTACCLPLHRENKPIPKRSSTKFCLPLHRGNL